MSEFLLHYQRVAPTTWVYLSSLLMIGLFFKFGRFWSVRNLDLILLILLAPGLLLVQTGQRYREPDVAAGSSVQTLSVDLPDEVPAEPVGSPRTEELQNAVPSSDQDPDDAVPTSDQDPDDVGLRLEQSLTPEDEVAEFIESQRDETIREMAADEAENGPMLRPGDIERWGYAWLFFVGMLLLVRLLVDSMMVRRPLLVPNLSVGGLTFIGCFLFVFLMANVIVERPSAEAASDGSDVTKADAAGGVEAPVVDADEGLRPGYAVLSKLPPSANKAIAILSHLAVVLGVVLIGYWHFDNITMGIGAATLYLMLPYTEQMTGYVDHVLPAAFLVWAVLCYPRPLAAGVLLGLAGGVVYYPLFLLPLWISFYSQRGLVRFLIGVVSTLAVLATVLAFQPGDTSYLSDLQRMFGLWPPRVHGLDGIWNTDIGGWDPHLRLPILAAFIALCAGLALWPAQKNLGTLLSCSAAVMLATQFWHGFGGGTYMAWYLPLTLLTIFRPNLEDRIALNVLEEGWFPRRRAQLSSGVRAA